MNEEPSFLPNGHAVDFVAAENRRYYKTFKDERDKKTNTKLDLSGLFRDDQDSAHQKEEEEEEEEEEQEEGKEKKKESGQSTYRVSEERKRAVPVVIPSRSSKELPRWDARWPIDVWISCGEPFVPLKGKALPLLGKMYV